MVFAYTLLVRSHKANVEATLLTAATWLLASLVYWILYGRIIPINSEISDENKIFRAYQQSMYKLTSLDACGGYSALAVCPNNMKLGRDEIVRASYKLRVLTPIIWAFSTFCLLVAIAEKVRKWYAGRKYETLAQWSGIEESKHGETEPAPVKTTPTALSGSFRSPWASTTIYWLMILCFLAGIGMQLSLLSVSTSLRMTNRKKWSFGQIVAITIWAPPLLGYLYDEINNLVPQSWRNGK